MMPLVASDVGNMDICTVLTSASDFVTINPNRGDKEFQLEIQPHLNSGLWPVYLDMLMRSQLPPSDGRQEAPGAVPPNPPAPTTPST